ncbi:MAG: DUF6172 family protein [Bacteriovoracaceae bacterium]
MKKVFLLTDPRKAPARQVEAVKYEISKYVARERRKPLKEGVDFWDFDCKLGPSTDRAVIIHVSEINKSIDKVVNEGAEQFYIEILARPGHRSKREV